MKVTNVHPQGSRQYECWYCKPNPELGTAVLVVARSPVSPITVPRLLIGSLTMTLPFPFLHGILPHTRSRGYATQGKSTSFDWHTEYET